MTLTEKINTVVLPSLRKGLEMEEKATPGPWRVMDIQGVSVWGQTQILPGEVRCEAPTFARITFYVADIDRENATFIAHTRNEWRKQTEALILAIEGALVELNFAQYRPSRGSVTRIENFLQSIANLWPDEV